MTDRGADGLSPLDTPVGVDLYNMWCNKLEAGLDMFSIYGRTGDPQKVGSRRPENVRQQCGIFCPVRLSCLWHMLRH